MNKTKTTKKKTVGRPKGTKPQKKVCSFRCSEKMRKKLNGYAALNDQTFTELIWTALKAYKPLNEITKDIK